MPRPIISTHSDSTALRLFPAGGITSSQDWLELAETARAFADANVYLTAHSTVELRNITQLDQAVERLSATSLHTSSCRVVASPLNARARQLAHSIGTAVPDSAAENLVVGVDAGDGTIESQGLDVCVYLAESSSEVRVSTAEQELSTTITEAPQAVAQLLHKLGSNNDAELFDATLPTTELPIGWLAEHMPEGRVELGVGLYQGVMHADIAELVGRMEVPVTITPWKGLIFHDLAEADAEVVVRVLAPRGLIFDVNSPFL
ncbi:cobalamin biosynthesis protein CobG [Corynebacterium ammoniagenes]|uniref:Nitrite/Sulfite reductase ferredoxin-like domain-containing protein n=2 Tax=Corynebacterium ammoniagenes TaxID=1697 RepID=A0AAV5GAA0_CORAM|nr:cobalamin biosynthesis protein CobG [Corynebacterium ammoniagenes]APT82616.1 cobalamin biosynthesis protein CobG [Corynebacterium ammoniagenes DSM 20306]AQS73683.1 cobalamin biosynthesis protein CobG [Corynebacterium ammoniagenes]EFG82348.1 hypothetical protein HMPREF0281_00378 [Corynebacterium ammoniagenes DSM 20306]NMF30773.1 cobalamin biosynthesis protein CobG [Corynebacterium ammoniagenes]GJN42451.1 hypothetical protein CAT723_09300 [Corynebacterium ammoniagenes]